jgi:hypothetical protein
MALIEREMLAVVGATAVAVSPKARGVARKGAVYGLAGALTLADVVASTARGAARGATQSAQAASDRESAARSRRPQGPGPRRTPAKKRTAA